jgi:hypothetical protein
MRKQIIILLILVIWLLPCQVVLADADKEAAALAAAETWLGLVDEAQYLQSWDDASGFFKMTVKKERWQELMVSGRKPLGKLISRKLLSKEYRTSLPGAPDGQYVMIQFQASFKNKKKAVETITPMLDKDGRWRVSGYFIK